MIIRRKYHTVSECTNLMHVKNKKIMSNLFSKHVKYIFDRATKNVFLNKKLIYN